MKGGGNSCVLTSVESEASSTKQESQENLLQYIQEALRGLEEESRRNASLGDSPPLDFSIGCLPPSSIFPDGLNVPQRDKLILKRRRNADGVSLLVDSMIDEAADIPSGDSRVSSSQGGHHPISFPKGVIQEKLAENQQMLFAIHENIKIGKMPSLAPLFSRVQQNLLFMAMLADQPSDIGPVYSAIRSNSPVALTEQQRLEQDHWSSQELTALHNALKDPTSDLNQLSVAVGTKSAEQIHMYLMRCAEAYQMRVSSNPESRDWREAFCDSLGDSAYREDGG